MINPIISSWIEQPDDFTSLRIHARQIRPLVAVAVETGIGKILRDATAAVLTSNDVINLERKLGICLG
jgi:hypothetical protein